MNLPAARSLAFLCLPIFAVSGCSNKKSLAKIHDLETQIEASQEENTTALNELNRQLTEREDAARAAQNEAAKQIQQLTSERDTAVEQLAAAKSENSQAEATRIAAQPKDSSTPGHPEFDPARDTKFTNALATITGDKTTGTGFVVSTGGKTYLYTSASLIAGNSRMTISNAAGTKFTKFGNLEVAEKTGFVRLELLETEAPPALKLADDDAKVSAETGVTCLAAAGGATHFIADHGNAQSQTEELINVDLNVIQGKASGPLLESATGNVIAIVIDPTAEPQHQLWVEPATGQAGEPGALRAMRLNRRVQWKGVPIGTFLAEAKKLAEYNRLTGVAQALAVINTSPGLGLATTIAGSRTAQSILADAKDVPVASEVITLRDDMAAKRLRLGEADLKKRFANIIASAMTQLQRGDAEFVPAKFNPYHRPYAEDSLKWRKEAVGRLQSAASSDSEPAAKPPVAPPGRNSRR
ncbi:MAG: hypothetical protein WCK77_03175 [Verrucomicrobiota bacterium]